MSDHTRSALNASGFLFQLRVEEEVRSGGQQNWVVAAREHPWKHEVSGRAGFADLVLEAAVFRLVIECKRSKNAHWYFITPADAKPIIRRSDVYWMHDVPNKGQRLGWGSLQFVPTTFESNFCVVRGSGENDQPLLERIGAMLIDSVEAIAREEMLHQRGTGRLRYLLGVPVIVTNSKLHVVSCDIPSIDLSTGEIDNVESTEVPFLRFRKALSHRFPWPSRVANLQEISQARQRTLFIVNSASLTQFLKTFNEARGFEEFPWVIAENVNAPFSNDLWS
ncbi:MAG TPA: hypothetical protein VGQ29_06270 [Gemmatimonadales bacterium]|jgi:hypothetical protein|nr:hypothetical protein [Gemmatimonadales bacterium]